MSYISKNPYAEADCESMFIVIPNLVIFRLAHPPTDETFPFLSDFY
jgi:hypothetical protein